MRTFFYFCFQTMLEMKILAGWFDKHVVYLQCRDDNKEII